MQGVRGCKHIKLEVKILPIWAESFRELDTCQQVLGKSDGLKSLPTDKVTYLQGVIFLVCTVLEN